MVQRYSESRGIGVKWWGEYRGSWGAGCRGSRDAGGRCQINCYFHLISYCSYLPYPLYLSFPLYLSYASYLLVDM